MIKAICLASMPYYLREWILRKYKYGFMIKCSLIIIILFGNKQMSIFKTYEIVLYANLEISDKL